MDQTIQNGECIVWIGATNPDGYGEFATTPFGKMGAHRAAWLLHVGDIPETIHVCHRCDNPPCVNPGHLFLGTALDNMRDRDAKGRRAPPKGSTNGRSKLNEDAVRSIHVDNANGLLLREIAAKHGVSISTICAIRKGIIWGHVLPETEPK